MGFDIKAALDGIVAFATQYYPFILAGFAILLLFGKNNPIRHGIQKALTDNWQLTLLASTGIALSLASGYTTFDGLRNFTSAPLLSVFISFGIQGVMLIVAWLIGESFAVGMNQRNSEGRRVRLVDASVGMLLGVAFVGIMFYWTLQQANAVSLTSSGGIKADMGRFADVAMYFLLALVLVAMLAFGFRRGGDISTPYVQSLRLIVKNAVLWVMFLASMAASVFFSFDSHFNAIFPSEARKRAAEIRTTNQIGGVISDIGALTQKRQIEEAERLFDTEGWKAYDKQLTSLGQTAQGAQGEIEKYFVQRMEERRRAIAQQQERVATAQSGQAGLAGKKVSLAEELSRLKVERPTLAAEYGQHQSELDAKAREIDAKRVEGLAEDRGVEGTLKQGKGPVYRQRQAELATLQDQYKIKQERTNDAKKRLTAVETRIAQIERELSTIDGDLAKLKGEASTAEQRIKAAEAVSADDDAGKVDPARVLPAFERARAAFRQQPDTERLGALQLQCTQLATAMLNAPAVRESARGIDCDPKQAAEAAARVFALNAGIAAFQTNCAGGDKIAKLSTTDGLLAFGRKCLQDSGLISKDSADVGARLSGIDMNRDDKAHRFVVTWNAFLDGNRLAYLSLVLAIGVDALVFMSGLFGAQALRSPLSDVPSPKATERASARGHHRGGAAARYVQKRAHDAVCDASAAAHRRLHQRGQALRARPRERIASPRCVECRRDHRGSAGNRRAWPLSRSRRVAHLPFRRDQARAQEEARGDGAWLGPRPTGKAHPRGADAVRPGHVGRRPAAPASDRRDPWVHVRDLPQRGRPAAPSAGAQSTDGGLEPSRCRARQERLGSLLRARRSLRDACAHQGARAGDGRTWSPAHRRRPAQAGRHRRRTFRRNCSFPTLVPPSGLPPRPRTSCG